MQNFEAKILWNELHMEFVLWMTLRYKINKNIPKLVKRTEL